MITIHRLNSIKADRRLNEISEEDLDLLISIAGKQPEGILKKKILKDIKIGREENVIFPDDFDLLISIAENYLKERIDD